MTASSTSAIAYRQMTRAEFQREKIISIVHASGKAGVTRRQILDAMRAMGIQIEYGSVSGRVADEIRRPDSVLWELEDTRENVTGMQGKILVHVDFRAAQMEIPV